MGGRQRSLTFGDAAELAEAAAAILAPRYVDRPRRALSIAQTEATAHAQYLESFGRDAIWFRYLAPPTPA
jgi:hypothetical protein